MREKLDALGKIQKSTKLFYVPIEKEVTKVDKDGNGKVVTISYKIKIIVSARFMVSSLSNLVDNHTEGIHKIICKYCDCFLEYESAKNINSYLSIKIIPTKLMKN